MPRFSHSKRPRLRLLSEEDIEKIHVGSMKLLEEIGVQMHNDRALKLLNDKGAEVDFKTRTVRVPQHLVKECLLKAPSTIRLYSRDGKHDRLLERERVTYNPGSSALFFLDSETGELRRPLSRDLARLVRLTDALEYIQAQSTSLVVSDVPEEVADRYRLFIVLKNSPKAVITGAFSIDGLHDMKKMLEIVAGGEKELARKPMAIFDTCPSAPLKWSEINSQNLIDCAKSRIPAEIIPMPQLGATGPVTLAGSLVQHNAEFLSGLVLAQLVNPGTPVIYGGSPTTFDMRHGTARLGAIETMMLGCSYSQVGKYYGLPTHMYLGLSDAKIVDTQCGLESGIAIVLGALAGINVISGPGMLNFENCQSLEKLVIDNTTCGMALRLIDGVRVDDETLAIDLMRKVGPGGVYLSEKHTLEWFRKEQFMPSALIDRKEWRTWKNEGSKSTLQRAKEHVAKILKEHQPEPLPDDIRRDLDAAAESILKSHKISA
ncbi:trimethylamine methyltransferase family protein [Candidatus Bathyarchaeota archaeon]|nr:trimethylamine methyltransferase family protein [Candidatus Bathyarchaeota archaeon]